MDRHEWYQVSHLALILHQKANKHISQNVFLFNHSFCFCYYHITIIFSFLCKHTENHWLNSDSDRKIQTHYKIRLISTISTTALLYVVVYWQYKTCMFFFSTHFMLEASESAVLLQSECPKWRSYQWMYDPAVLTGCTYCLHAYPEWMQTPLNLWGPLYNNWRNVSSIEYCKARWPECLEMCTIFF